MPYYGPVIDPWGGTKKGLDVLAEMPSQMEDRAWKNETRGYARQERERQESLRSALQGAMQGETDLEKAQGIREAYGANAPEKIIEGDKIIQSVMTNSPSQLDAARQVKEIDSLLAAAQEVKMVKLRSPDGELTPDQKKIFVDKFTALSGGKYSADEVNRFVESVTGGDMFTQFPLGDMGMAVIGPDGNWKVVQNPMMRGGMGKPDAVVVQTPEGMYSFDKRSKEVAPLQFGGKPLVGSTSSPELQQELSGAKEFGKVKGKTTAEAQVSLPANVQEADDTVRLVDELLTHPGFSQSVGKSSMAGIQYVPGTDSKAFMTRLNQLKGKQFLQAYQTLKGGGQITEVEGKKATEAMSRMDNFSTEDEFVTAAREFQDIIKKGVERARQKAGQTEQSATDTQTGKFKIRSVR